MTSAAEAPSRAEVDATLRAVLADPAYHFCNDRDFTWSPSEWSTWCKTGATATSRCAAVVKSCEGAPPPREPWTFPSLGPGILLLIWIGFFVAIAVLVMHSLRRGRLWRRGPKLGEDAAPEAALAMFADPPHETEVSRLLAQARRLAAEGRFGDAIGIAYSALLHHLERERMVRLHPSRTNGDYLRDLRARAEVLESVRPIVREVERVQFGLRPATGEQFESLFRSVTTVVEGSSARAPLTARWASTFVMVACCLTLVSCTRWFLETIDSAPSGTRALAELLKKMGFEPSVELRPWKKKDGQAEQIVLLPRASVSEEHWRELMDWTRDGGTLVVANRDPQLAKWLNVEFADARPPGELQVGEEVRALREASVVVPDSRELRCNETPCHTLLSKPAGGAFVTPKDAHIYAARIDHGVGHAIVLADGLLMTNIGLSVADNASVVLGLFEPHKKRIALVAGATESGGDNPFASVQHGMLAPALVQLLILLTLLFVHKGFAFGTLVDPPVSRSKSFALHVRALGLLYAKAQAAPHARAVYSTFALERLRGGMPGEAKGVRALAEGVTARTGLPFGEVNAVLEQAENAKSETAAPASRGSLQTLDLVRQLSRILRQVTSPRARGGRLKGGSG